MKYRLTEHTADFGIHVFGADPADLFANAAFALFDVMTDLNTVKGADSRSLEVTGEDWPDLMVNWLRELLSLWSLQNMLVKKTTVDTIGTHRLSARIAYDPYDPKRHTIREEIKAVTYHQIDVRGGSTGWEAKIIFDV